MNILPSGRILTLAATAAVLLLTCGRSVMAEVSANTGRSLNAVVSGVLAAWNRGDAHGIAVQYEPQGDFVSPDGLHAEGPREIETFYEGAFARGYAGSRATARILHVRYLSATIALIDGTWSIDPTMTSKIRQPEGGLFFGVLRRHDGRWRIAALREQSSARKLRDL